jgi:hypothetical protein
MPVAGARMRYSARDRSIALLRALEARKLPTRLVTRGGKRAIGSAMPSRMVRSRRDRLAERAAGVRRRLVVYHCAGAPYHRWAQALPG